MIDTDYALEVLPRELIIRLKLTVRGRTGDEKLEAAVLCHHYDDDGPLLGCVSSSLVPFMSVRTLTVRTSAVETEWPDFLREATADWDLRWSNSDRAIYQLDPHYRQPRGLDELQPSHTLVLQHLARFHGMVWQAYACRKNADEGAILHTIDHRLAAVIAQANNARKANIVNLEMFDRLSV